MSRIEIGWILKSFPDKNPPKTNRVKMQILNVKFEVHHINEKGTCF